MSSPLYCASLTTGKAATIMHDHRMILMNGMPLFMPGRPTRLSLEAVFKLFRPHAYSWDLDCRFGSDVF